MGFFTIKDLKEAAQEALGKQELNAATAKDQLLTEAVSQRVGPLPKEPAAIPPVLFDIYLSYGALDDVLLLGLYKRLSGQKFRVYLDRIGDPQLEGLKLNRLTCRTLRYRMAQSRCFFAATTETGPKSPQLLWELGFVDGWNRKTAILPILSNEFGSFKGEELFQLYPEVRLSGIAPDPRTIEIWEGNRNMGTWEAWLTTPRWF